VQAAWELFAKGKPLTDRNAWISSNLSNLRSETDLSKIVASPGANGGLVATSIAATASGSDIAVTLGQPTLPTGWAITGGIAIAYTAQDPTTATDYESYAGKAVTTPFNPTISSPPSGDYEVAGFFQYTKADGSVAYGPSMVTTVTVS
jgi:hypothetical protein